MQISFPLPRLKWALLTVWVLLVTGGLCAELWKWIVGRRIGYDIVRFIGLSYEQNLPTWYSASLLLSCAIILLLIWRAKAQASAPFRWHWGLLSASFFYISLDETVTLHEDLNDFFDLGGVFYFGWVIPASILVLIMGLAYLPFLAHLPQRTRRYFVAAGVVYVGGAMGVELILGYWTDLAGSRNLVYGLIDLVEESMEMMGITMFLLSLLEYMAGEEQTITLGVR